jgi:hypothetical protein
MNWKYIFNPFLKFSERNLFTIGFLSIFVGSFLASYFSVSYDGIFDAHSSSASFIRSLKENFLNIGIVFLMLLIFGKIINKKTRIIDILNLSMIYRIPIYLISICISFGKNIDDKILIYKDNLQNIKLTSLDIISIIISSILLIILIIYAIVLLVNGFKTATNLKKQYYYVFFAITLTIGEIISKILITYL